MPTIRLRLYWSVIRSLGMLFALGLSAFGFLQVVSRAQSSTSGPIEEAALRAVVEKFFTAYGKKDMPSIIALWSEKSPNLVAYKQSLQQQFTSEDLSLGSPTISRVKVEGEKASLRATITITSINLKNQQKSEQRLVRSFEFVSESGDWKVWRYASAAEDLAEALAKASIKEERAKIVAEEKEPVTVELGQALLTQGRRLSNQRSYSRAVEIYELAVAIAEQLGDKKVIASALRSIGIAHWSLGNYTQALDHYRKSLKICEEIGDKAGISKALNNIGFTHMSRGNYTEALEHLRKGLKISEEIGDKADIALILTNTGIVYQRQGKYTEALEIYQKALKIYEEIGDKAGISGALNDIGVVYRLQGNYTQALEQYQKSLKISEELGDKAGIARVLNNIGVVHESQGNYTEALEQYQKSLKIKEELRDKALIASTLSNIGNVYHLQGNQIQALAQYQKSLKFYEDIGNKAGIAGVLGNIGLVHRSQGNYTEALEHYQKGLKISEEIGNKAVTAAMLNHIGQVHNSQSNYSQALEFYQKSLKISEEIGDKGGIATTLRNIGNSHQAQGDYSRALQFAERAADLATRIDHNEDLWKARGNAGNAYFALKQFSQARLSYDQAITIIESLRTQVVGSGQEQQRFFESKLSPYHMMVELLIAQNNPGEALIYAERAKARVLLDVLSSGRAGVTKSMTGPEIEQERKLNSQLVSLNTQIYREKQRQQADQDRLKQLDSELEKARLDFDAFQTSLYAAHPELKTQRGEAPPMQIEQINALVHNAGTALLEFVVVEERTYLFVLTKSTTAELKVYPLEIKRKDLTNRVEQFRRQMADRGLLFKSLSQELYGLLLKPAQKQLENKTSFVISPDGPLWDLPFQVLQSERGRYLIEGAAISYTPSLSVLREVQLLRKKKQAPAQPSLLALGNPTLPNQSIESAKFLVRDGRFDPLPEAEREVQALERFYGKTSSKIYTGAAAREEVVKQESARYRILHLATHGVLNDKSPMYSNVLLSQASGKNDEDGLLEAWEIMNLDLDADLVVLSACETARGRVSAGEGVIGMSWALFVAGCPRTVVSQWKVNSESTAELMVEFHKGFKTRFDRTLPAISTAEALRQAALKLMRTNRYSHPFYWGGFVVVGDGS